MISGTQTEKMDHFELLKITEGKNRKRSLVFYIVDHKNEKNMNFSLTKDILLSILMMVPNLILKLN